MARLRLPGCVVECAVVGDGPAVLLLHGWPQTGYAWRHVVPLLADRYTVVVPDLPGFGASSRMTGGYDKRSVAEVVHRLMTSLGFGRYHVVGHDVGGQVAYPLAALHGDALLSLTFVEAGIPGLGDSLAAANPLTGGSWHFGFNMVPDLPEFLLAGRERGYLEFMFRRDSIGLYVTDAIDDVDLDVYARALAAPGAVRATMGYYRALLQDVEDNRAFCAAGPVTVSTLVVGARYGVGLGWLDTVEAAASDVSSCWVEDCGHYVPEERPAELAGILVERWES
ncbi:alpha/beta fold hydrolase [Amycolatopsis tucumanensis]|uniref:alpha/beta fold hydrolase n=1 Tax=Amycolatopsis tucumanensis TaxID=401106 RepID=UPI001F232B06|nr:alpha/beta hydrolase [Amycolatopsis tucumanensis]MCF6421420.1 alpha/beta hydrolase [Amycolatopsis tucumanensis]